MADIAREARKAGAYEVLTKPASLIKLRLLLDQALGC
jgi:hypothetical protein